MHQDFKELLSAFNAGQVRSIASKRIVLTVNLTVKTLSSSLFLIFTVKPDLRLFKSLQLTEFFALQIAGLGNS